jgi:hypothetical protein
MGILILSNLVQNNKLFAINKSAATFFAYCKNGKITAIKWVLSYLNEQLLGSMT